MKAATDAQRMHLAMAEDAIVGVCKTGELAGEQVI